MSVQVKGKTVVHPVRNKTRALRQPKQYKVIARGKRATPAALSQIQAKLNSLVSPAEAQRWLNAPNATLDGRRPIDLISQGESDRVMEILIGLEEGIHA